MYPFRVRPIPPPLAFAQERPREGIGPDNGGRKRRKAPHSIFVPVCHPLVGVLLCAEILYRVPQQ